MTGSILEQLKMRARAGATLALLTDGGISARVGATDPTSTPLGRFQQQATFRFAFGRAERSKSC